MVTDKTMGIILAYSVPYIQDNLRSVDFLNNNVQKVQGKTPFYDTETPTMQVSARTGKMPHVRTRPSIHLKDSWRIEVSAKGGLGYVYLSNSKRTADGKWDVSDLLWYGTRDYQTDVPTIRIDVPVFYEDVIFSAVPGVGMTQAEALRKLKKYRGKDTIRQILLAGHHTGRMTFYNRYTGKWHYNRTFRRGIRNELVTSFKQYLLLCVENGIRRGIELLQNEERLMVKITNVHVKVAS